MSGKPGLKPFIEFLYKQQNNRKQKFLCWPCPATKRSPVSLTLWIEEGEGLQLPLISVPPHFVLFFLSNLSFTQWLMFTKLCYAFIN